MTPEVVRGDSLVIGGGLVGAAMARAEVAAGRRVTVASRHARDHAGLWRQFHVGDEPVWRGHPERVFIAVAPGSTEKASAVWGESLAKLIARMAPSPVVLLGPAGVGEPSLDAFDALVGRLSIVTRVAVLRVPPLFGAEDRLIWPAACALRVGAVATVPRSLPVTRPLAVDDVVRAAQHLCGDGGDWSLAGAEHLDIPTLIAGLQARFGGQWRTRWTLGPWRADELRRARAQSGVHGEWDDERFGSRTSFATWAARLPGPTRRR